MPIVTLSNGLKLVLVVLVVLAFATQSVMACSCANVTVEEAFESADAVFQGQVVTVSKRYVALARGVVLSLFQDWVSGDLDVRYGIRAHLNVAASWKGGTGKKVAVYTGRGGGDCGFPFEEGRDYVVFAHRSEGDSLVTSSCTFTAPVVEWSSDMLRLLTSVSDSGPVVQ